MAYNEKLADRTREIIARTHKKVEEKRMFGGLCFMVNDKMCVGVEKDRLMVRLNPELFDEVMEKEGCEPMDFTGKVMKGFVFVSPDGVNSQQKLAIWLEKGIDFVLNSPAKKKSSATKKKKTVAKKKSMPRKPRAKKTAPKKKTSRKKRSSR